MSLSDWLLKKIISYLSETDGLSLSYMCDFSRICQEVKMADVLLIEGDSRVARIIQRSTQSAWTHAALYIGRIHDIEDPVLREKIQQASQVLPHEQLIIESQLGQGTAIVSLNRYKDDHIRICRPSGLNFTDAQAVITEAVSHLGVPYDLRHIIDLWRFCLKTKFLPRRFASSLFKRKPGLVTQEICTSMIADSFKSVQFPILPLVRKDEQNDFEMIHRNSKLFTPRDFDHSPYFDIIKYPIFELSNKTAYRDLPWKEGVESHDDEVVVEKPLDVDTEPDNESKPDNESNHRSDDEK